MVLGRGSTLYSVDHVPFINTLAKDDRYFLRMRKLGKSTPKEQEEICAIASAISLINEQYRNHPKYDGLFGHSQFKRNSPGGYLIFDDKEVVEALLDHPDKAALIAKTYLERWSVDSLGEVLDSPAAVAEGAL